jgi:hypothetical protein
MIDSADPRKYRRLRSRNICDDLGRAADRFGGFPKTLWIAGYQKEIRAGILGLPGGRQTDPRGAADDDDVLTLERLRLFIARFNGAGLQDWFSGWIVDRAEDR